MFLNVCTDHVFLTKRWIKERKFRALRKGVKEVLRGVKVHWPRSSAPTSWAKAELRLMLPSTYRALKYAHLFLYHLPLSFKGSNRLVTNRPCLKFKMYVTAKTYRERERNKEQRERRKNAKNRDRITKKDRKRRKEIKWMNDERRELYKKFVPSFYSVATIMGQWSKKRILHGIFKSIVEYRSHIGYCNTDLTCVLSLEHFRKWNSPKNH